MKNKTAAQVIMTLLNSRKTGLTAKEIQKKTGLNAKTTRNNLAILVNEDKAQYDEYLHKCKVSGNYVTHYKKVADTKAV